MGVLEVFGALALTVLAAPPRWTPNTAMEVGLGGFLRTANKEGVSREEREDTPPTCSPEPWNGIIAEMNVRVEIKDRRMVLILFSFTEQVG